MIEHSGPDDSQGNGRVEREIQTARGLARSLVSQLTENAKVEINVYGPIYQWAMRHAGWLLSHYRRQSGSPTAYEMVSGRKYIGKLAMFGERVLARLPTANGENRFKTGVWVGKTDRADFHIVFTEGGLRWTHTIRRLPVPFEAEALTLVKAWPWSVSFGQIGAKQSALMTKVPGLALPPDMAPAIRAEEAQERRRAAGVQAGGEQEQQAGQDRHQRQAGLQDEAASDPSSTSSSSSSADKGPMDDDTLLADLLAEVNEDKTYEGGVETPPSQLHYWKVRGKKALLFLLQMQKDNWKPDSRRVAAPLCARIWDRFKICKDLQNCTISQRNLLHLFGPPVRRRWLTQN